MKLHVLTLILYRIPTAAYAVGLVGTVFWGILSDRLNTRIWIALAITVVNIVSNAVLAASPSKPAIFFGYMINAATYAYGPVIISHLNEVFSALPEERALILGIAQAMGAAFSAWVPLFIFNTGTQGPLFQVRRSCSERKKDDKTKLLTISGWIYHSGCLCRGASHWCLAPEESK